MLASDADGVFDTEVVCKILTADSGFTVPEGQRKKLKLCKDMVDKEEVDMKFEVTITRVQVTKRYVTATDQEAVAEKIKETLDARSYSLYANFETLGTDIEAAAVKEENTVKPMQIDRKGSI